MAGALIIPGRHTLTAEVGLGLALVKPSSCPLRSLLLSDGSGAAAAAATGLVHDDLLPSAV